MAWFNCHKSDKGIKQGGILNVQAPAPGQSGYINFARIKLLDSYANHTCCFVIQNRGIYFPVMLSIGFQNINHTDPGLISFLYWGAADYGIYAVQNTTSVWDLYVKKTEPYDAVEILNLNYDTAHFEITFPNAFTKEKGEEWMSPQPGGRVAGADHVYDSENDGGITFSYAKPGLRRGEFTWLAAWNGYEMRAIHNNIFTYLKKTGDYYGMCIPYEDGTGANDQVFIRTTSQGLIPYRSDQNYGESEIGTDLWPFKNGHFCLLNLEYLVSRSAYSPASNITFKMKIRFTGRFIYVYNEYDGINNAICFVQSNSGTELRPYLNNHCQIGNSSVRFKDLYIVNSPNISSDRNEKKEISYIGYESEYEDTYMSDDTLIKFINGLLACIFKRKNGDSDRPHHGFIAQEIEKLLQKLGIKDHAGLIKSPKTEQIEIEEEIEKEITDTDGTVKIVKEKQTRIEDKVIPNEYVYGLRYEEFISDVIRFVQILYQQNQEQQEKIESLEKRLTDLENIIKQRA